MLNLREAYAHNGSTTLETRSHEMHFYRSILRRKTRQHTTFDTAWALDPSKVRFLLLSYALVLTARIQDCPTIPSGRDHRSHVSPTILEEGSVNPPSISTQTAKENADVAKQGHGSDTFEERGTSSLDNKPGTHEEPLTDKETKSNEYGVNQHPLVQEK